MSVNSVIVLDSKLPGVSRVHTEYLIVNPYKYPNVTRTLTLAMHYTAISTFTCIDDVIHALQALAQQGRKINKRNDRRHRTHWIEPSPNEHRTPQASNMDVPREGGAGLCVTCAIYYSCVLEYIRLFVFYVWHDACN